ncbi:MAG: metallophosphoesterase [Planctomycetota bacterium]|nr:metallophosphoesterase [Planctomycetota bacterium]
MNHINSMKNWTFLHACDMQPGSPRSFRFNPRFMENWQTAFSQLKNMEADLLLVGGDLTRDGTLHDFEFEAIRNELTQLPYPTHCIPGNMDVGNKFSDIEGFTERDDPSLNATADALDRFTRFFGEFPWSFTHKNVRFSGFYAALAGSELPHEERMWTWLEQELPSLPKAEHHVMTMHYPLFIDRPDEPTWDITKKEEYTHWYFSIDEPHRSRIFNAFKSTDVGIVFSGHIHCRRPVQIFDGIRFYKCAGIGFPQWGNQWEDGDPTLGFYKCDVSQAGIKETFIPLESESTAEGAYGPGGHPKPEERDYSLAWK